MFVESGLALRLVNDFAFHLKMKKKISVKYGSQLDISITNS
jgi:hypothetical protein